jgi:hypothetical protein
MVDVSSVRNLDSESWKKHDNELSRLAALQSLENDIAKQQGRTPCGVYATDERKSGEGFYDRDSRNIYVSSEDLRSPLPHEAVNTVAHEGRHDYQHHVKDHPGSHSELSDAKKIELSNNLQPGNYIQPAKDPIGYWNQPVEKDAREFADSVENQVCGKRPAEELTHIKSAEQTSEIPDLIQMNQDLIRSDNSVAAVETEGDGQQASSFRERMEAKREAAQIKNVELPPEPAPSQGLSK